MISFYPGPSRVYDEVPTYVRDAHRKGLLSMNHRSEAFMDLYRETVLLLRQKLDVPKTYSVFFLSSATECWEVLAQSLTREKSIHVFNGAFGEKWFDYARRIHPSAEAITFDRNASLDPKKLLFDAGDLICLTQNETSNGTQISNDTIRKIAKANPKHLVAVDATSSMAGIYLNFKNADIWFASVQKCFGLPAGLGLMICSPRAIHEAETIQENRHYNSVLLLNDMMRKWQTSCTPNVLGIYLLKRTLEKAKPVRETDKVIRTRYESWMDFFEGYNVLTPLIKHKTVHSFTVMTLTGEKETLARLKKAALKQGIQIGEGYGALKGESIRIANFPAIKDAEIKKLKQLLESFK